MDFGVIWFDFKGVRLRFFNTWQEALDFQLSLVTDFQSYLVSVEQGSYNKVQNAIIWAQLGDIE